MGTSYSTGTTWTSGPLTYTITYSASRPVGAHVLATDEERDEWLDEFEADNGKLSAVQRESLKKAIAGWAAR